MNPENNEKIQPTFTQRVGALILDKKPEDKHNGMVEVHQTALFNAILEKVRRSKVSEAEALADLNNKEMSFEDLEKKYRLEETKKIVSIETTEIEGAQLN